MTKKQRRWAAKQLTPRIKLLRAGLKKLDARIADLYRDLYKSEKQADKLNCHLCRLINTRRKLLNG